MFNGLYFTQNKEVLCSHWLSNVFGFMRYKIFYRYFRRRLAVKQKAFEEKQERKRIERQSKSLRFLILIAKIVGLNLKGYIVIIADNMLKILSNLLEAI